jgi:multicomponent Na+:H+ antiporter subunit F
MTGFLLGAGVFILLTVLLGLLRVLRGPGDAERMMAVNLLGTGGVAALLLLGSAVDLTAATDLALVLVLLAAFGSVAFVAGLGGERGHARAEPPAQAPSSPAREATRPGD